VLVTTDGEVYAVGQTETEFTIQSISKAFVYATALADRGREAVLSKVYVEPSGEAFNSISLHTETGAPLNPMINAGAIATVGLVGGDTPEAQWQRIIGSLSGFAGRPLSVDDAVYQSESDTGFRNRAIGWMLRNFDIIEQDPTQIVENYFRQCSVLVHCRDLGIMGATLANGGVNPLTGERVLPADIVGPSLSVMSTCGMYDYAGSWMFEVGLPAKSGVGGGIVAVLPGRFAIATFSPRLDAKGNSVRGIEVCKALSQELGLHMMGTLRNASQVIAREYSGAEASSNRMRSSAAKKYLAGQGRRIRIFALQGDIALDGAERITRQLVKDASMTHVLLDMHRVSFVSAPAAKLILESIRHLHQRGGDLAFARINQGDNDIEATLRACLPDGGMQLNVFQDTDRAMEWCENQVLHTCDNPGDAPMQPSLKDFELFSSLSDEDCATLTALLQEANYPCGSAIVEAGTSDDDRIFLLLSGEVSVLVNLNQGTTQRLATLGPGMTFGEMVMLGQTTRTATIQADTDVNCKTLRASDLDKLAASRPLLKIAILNNLATLLAEKLKQANGLVATLAG
jgi:glutaminase